ncbi:hypothetical protein PILCRDRAFT_8240 [Piloderma croceum F 1598]|uniref:Uncharacterized protein n=1 Tax=Piloderma croceum (strain F 1598) TaxID=765440 RepID=A0A0C3BX40_PILCF|nr:hypothetical protein PILCRDRAFT_8240 [Piloderma croceum F 1598]
MSVISTLSQNLRWLVRIAPVKQCFIVATPDPRIIEPYSYPKRHYPQYMLRFGRDRGIETENYAYYLPSFAYAYNNIGSSTPIQYIPRGRSRASKYSKHSNWCPIVVTGQTNSAGETAREVLIDIIDNFPTYNLCCVAGIGAAIEVGAHEYPDKK